MAEEENSGSGLDVSIDDAVTSEGSTGSSGGSSGRGTGGRRSPVIVKGEYGTEFFDETTGCRECSRRAVGVLVTKRSLGNKDTKKGVPLCTTCKEELVSDKGLNEDQLDWRRFVD